MGERYHQPSDCYGQFRTPKHIREMMVELLQPTPDETICERKILYLIKYVTQDTPPQKKGKYKTIYVFKVDYVYRVLFCKNVFFADEQEYRILLPTGKIESGTKYPFSTNVEIKVKNIKKFFK